jgi:hypothetical protein
MRRVANAANDPANDPANDAFALPAMQCGIDCRTISQIGKIRLGQGPHPPISIDPAKYLLFNGLLYFDATVSARKNTTFFLQHRGTGGGGIGQGGGRAFVPRGTSSRDDSRLWSLPAKGRFYHPPRQARKSNWGVIHEFRRYASRD